MAVMVQGESNCGCPIGWRDGCRGRVKKWRKFNMANGLCGRWAPEIKITSKNNTTDYYTLLTIIPLSLSPDFAFTSSHIVSVSCSTHVKAFENWELHFSPLAWLTLHLLTLPSSSFALPKANIAHTAPSLTQTINHLTSPPSRHPFSLDIDSDIIPLLIHSLQLDSSFDTLRRRTKT